ncbi:hypothetical protein ACH5RR_014566 [Cinchona calisaya]|uniref:ABC transporter domain-containing protein n=1 Tax=Cinchona calisaya TaxID=153742 RepID=A0ABD3A3B7_9GENT
MPSCAHQLWTAVGSVGHRLFFFFLPRLSFRAMNKRKTRAVKVCCDYSCYEIKDVSYRPCGTKVNLLDGVTFSLREKSFGLIFGRSGSGKTTLLQLIAGFSKPMSGSICVQRYSNDGCPNRSPELLEANRVGIVFQFPERLV